MATSELGIDHEPTADAAAARLVRRVIAQWPLIIGLALVAAIAGYFASASRTKMYSATTIVQLNQIDLSAIFIGQNLQQQGQDVDTLSATNAKLVSLPLVRQAASVALGGRVTPAQIKQAITVTPDAGTTLVAIAARDPDPRLAARIADAVRMAFITTRRNASLAQLTSAKSQAAAQLQQLSPADRASAVGQTLRQRIVQLDTLKAASSGGVQTVQPAVAGTSPVSPRPLRDAVIALLLAVILGVSIALLRARTDDHIRDGAELGEVWELPVLGLVPQTSDLRESRRHLPSGPALEAFALARTNLRYLHVGGDVKTVVVTSAVAGEGKSTVAWNLGIAAALADSRVLLVEADLRRPVFASRLGLTNTLGLSEVLAGITTVDRTINTVRLEMPGAAPEIAVDVIVAGMTPPSPIALLERRGIGELFKALGEEYDMVIIDTPPATIVADAKVILNHADGVVVVSRLGRVSRSALSRLRNILSDLDTPVLGTIVNGGASAKAYSYAAYTADGDHKVPRSYGELDAGSDRNAGADLSPGTRS